MKYNYQLHIVPTFRRTLWGINGNASCNAPALPYSTLERLYGIPTPERGNDAVYLFQLDGAAS